MPIIQQHISRCYDNLESLLPCRYNGHRAWAEERHLRINRNGLHVSSIH